MDDLPRLLRSLVPLLHLMERAMSEGILSDGGNPERDRALIALRAASRGVPEDIRSMKPGMPWEELCGGGPDDMDFEGLFRAIPEAMRSILSEFGLDTGTLVHHGEAERSYAVVIDSFLDGREARLLFLDGVLSSGEHADGSPALCYPPAMSRAFGLLDSPKKALIIGVAGGTLVGVLRGSFPAIESDCVDIDRKVVDIGSKYFSLRADGRTRIHIADGRDFVRGEVGPYDLVLMDAFAGLSPVPRLSSVEFVRELKCRLSPGAVCAINIIAKVERSGYLQHVFGTWRSAFSDVAVLPLCAEGDTFNVVLVATDRDTSRFRSDNRDALFEMEFDTSKVLRDGDGLIDGLSPF